jgi:hypothetical protein
MMYVPQIGENTGKVLSVVLEQAMYGYTLRSKTGLADTELVQALEFLKANELIDVDGNLSPEAVRSVYVWVPPSMKGSAQLALRGLRSQQSKAP